MIELIVLFLIAVLMLIFIPFVGSLEVPTILREISVVLTLIAVIVLTVRKRTIFYFLLAFTPVALALTIIWRMNSPESLPDIIYLLSYMVLAVTLLRAMERMPRLGFLLSRFLLSLVLFLAIWSILAFITYNLGLLPFRAENLGGLAYYHYYYNPLVGYIDTRGIGGVVMGRVAGFMAEPSYIGWFLASNFFLMDSFFKKRELKGIVCKVIILTGAICTFSTGALVVLSMMIVVSIGFSVLRKIGMREKGINVLTWIFVIALPLAIIFVPKDSVGDKIGGSANDREGRMEATFLILGTSGIKDILLGHSPGFIEKTADVNKGESNAYLKLIVEEGIILLFVICGFIVYCTRGNRNYMMATLIFLNSVVILTTPLFVVNIVICKWLEVQARQKKSNEIGEEV